MAPRRALGALLPFGSVISIPFSFRLQQEPDVIALQFEKLLSVEVMMFGDQQEQSVSCPYCGETISILVDTSVPEQAYVEDCSVCCRPIDFRAFVTDGHAHVEARTDSE